jgi:hypothetical protein
MRLGRERLRMEEVTPAWALVGRQADMVVATLAAMDQAAGLVDRAALEVQGMEAMVALVGQEASGVDRPSVVTLEAQAEVRQVAMAKVDGTVMSQRKEEEKAKETVSLGAAPAEVRRALTRQGVLVEVQIGATGPVHPVRARRE